MAPDQGQVNNFLQNYFQLALLTKKADKAEWGTGMERAMPLTKKGRKIKAAMADQYGPKKGEQVFYASRNKGTISGVDRTQKGRKGKGSRGT